MASDQLSRRDIQIFLEELRAHFSKQFGLPAFIQDMERDAPRAKDLRHQYEDFFVKKYILPSLLEFIQTQPDTLGARLAQDVICTGWADVRRSFGFSKLGGSKGHPFTKALGQKPSKLFELWKPGGKRKPGFEAWPDLALTAPYKVLFECKYFTREANLFAKDALVEYLYEAFFYRALPRREEDKKRPGWDYEYSCLLAYDATRNHRLANAWNEVKGGIEKNFWDSGNIFVMMLPEISQ